MDWRWHYKRRLDQIRERRWLHALLRQGITMESHSYVAPGTHIDGKLQLEHGARITGAGSFIGSEPIVLGRYATLGPDVRVISSNHDYSHVNMQGDLGGRLGTGYSQISKGPVKIGAGTWIGQAAIILSGVTIGDGAVVGAGSVVTRDVAPFGIVAGNPARLIRMRFDQETIERIDGWWNWSEEEMRERAELFTTPPTESGRVSLPSVA